jgi:hypothetical protein
MALTDKVEEFKSTLASSSPLTAILQKSFLSEKEIVKKILSIKSPELSLSDIDVMLDGGAKNLLFDYANLGGLVGQLGNLGGIGGQLGNLGGIGGQLGNLGGIGGQLGNLGGIGGQLGNLGGIGGQLGNLGGIGGQLGNLGGIGGVGNILQQFNAFKSVPGPETVYSLLNKSKAAVSSGIFPLPQSSPLFDEARDMKQRVLVCITILSNIQISLLQEIIRVSIQIGTSISGMAILVAPMSFNVPAAISMLLLIVDQLSNICKTILSCLPFLDCLKLLDFVIDNVPSNPVITGLEVAITFLNGTYKLCSILKQFIDKLFEALSKLTGKGKGGCEKEKRKYNRKKKKLVKEIREILDDPKFGEKGIEDGKFEYRLVPSEADEFYFPELEDRLKSLQDSGKISEDDADNARDIQDEIKSFDDRIKIICGFVIPETINGEIDLDKINLDNEVFETIRDIKNITDAIATGREKYVYDAELPDGTVIKDLDIDDIKDLQEKFDIIFKSNDNLNQ